MKLPLPLTYAPMEAKLVAELEAGKIGAVDTIARRERDHARLLRDLVRDAIEWRLHAPQAFQVRMYFLHEAIEMRASPGCQGAHRAARWLGDADKAVLERELAAEAASKRHLPLRQVFASGTVWLLALVYFLFVMGLYGVSFWLPQLLKNSGVQDVFHIGLLTAIPYGVAAVVMVLAARHSDRSGERRWHTALPLIVIACTLCTVRRVPRAPSDGQRAQSPRLLLSSTVRSDNALIVDLTNPDLVEGRAAPLPPEIVS